MRRCEVSLQTGAVWTDQPIPRATNVLTGRAAQDPLQIVRGEYLEIPGLRLTRNQLRQLWDLDDVLCDKILDALVAVRFLRPTAGGAFVRADDKLHAC
jgi:hypothetical protein